MPNQQSAKGNPASHRMSNPKRKARRESCFTRGQKRKDQRVRAQHAQEQTNKKLRIAGKLTPWQEAKAARKARRAVKVKVKS